MIRKIGIILYNQIFRNNIHESRNKKDRLTDRRFS